MTGLERMRENWMCSMDRIAELLKVGVMSMSRVRCLSLGLRGR